MTDEELLRLKLLYANSKTVFGLQINKVIDELTEARQREAGIVAELERKSKDLRAWEIDARTAQARLRELEAGTVCTQAQTDIIVEAMRKSQTALAELAKEAL